MIIRENGIVVGKLDDRSLQLIDSTSQKLTDLVDEWRSNGKEVMADSGEERPANVSGDSSRHVPFTTDNLSFYGIQLQIAGFEVQTA